MLIYELEVLNCLNFNTSRVLAIDFLYYFAFDAGFKINGKRSWFALYLLNISYHNPLLYKFSKSLIAFSIIYFVNKIFGKKKEWPQQYSPNQNQNSNQAKKKYFYLKIDENLQDWQNYKQQFIDTHETFLDDPSLRIKSNLNNKTKTPITTFLSKFSNGLDDSKINNLKRNSTMECLNITSVCQNSSNQIKENITSNTNQINTFDSDLNSQSLQSNTVNYNKKLNKSACNSKEVSQEVPVINYQEIRFEVSKVKNVSMNIFLGNNIRFANNAIINLDLTYRIPKLY